MSQQDQLNAILKRKQDPFSQQHKMPIDVQLMKVLGVDTPQEALQIIQSAGI